MSFLKHLIRNAYYKHQYHNKYDYGIQDYHGHDGFMGMPPMLQHFLKRSKKLIFVFLSIVGVILLLLTVLLIVLSPMILNAVDWVYHNGVGGIIKLLQTILDKLWKGAGA